MSELSCVGVGFVVLIPFPILLDQFEHGFDGGAAEGGQSFQNGSKAGICAQICDSGGFAGKCAGFCAACFKIGGIIRGKLRCFDSP